MSAMPWYLNPALVRGWLRSNAIRRGLLGWEPRWLAVLGAGLLIRAVDRARKRGPMPVVLTERLQPGQTLVIEHIGEVPRRRRRRSG